MGCWSAPGAPLSLQICWSYTPIPGTPLHAYVPPNLQGRERRACDAPEARLVEVPVEDPPLARAQQHRRREERCRLGRLLQVPGLAMATCKEREREREKKRETRFGRPYAVGVGMATKARCIQMPGGSALSAKNASE